MRANAPREDGVAVVQQVVCGDGRAQVGVASGHVLSGFFCGDVFHHNFQARKVTAQRDQMLLNEHGFAVKQVDVGRCDFAVHQQQHAFALHGFEDGVDFAQIGHARVAVGGGACWVQLASHHASGLGAGNLGRGQVVGQVQRHEWLKSHARWHGGQDALLVGQSLLGRGHGRLEVGHDDGAAELGGGVGHHHIQGGAIAHVQVPVIGAGEGEFLGHGAYCLKPVGRGAG